MTVRNNLKNTLFVTTLALGFWGCSGGPSVQDIPTTANTNEEVMMLDADINAALANQEDVLSPNNFKQAKHAARDAKESLDKKEDAKETLAYVAKSRAYLKLSNDFSKVAHTNIEDVIVARQQAIAADAPKSFTSQFKEIEDNLIEVTSEIEKNELGDATANRSKLQLAYLNLELKAIKQANLGKAHEVIAKAVKEGAEEFAPQSLAIAKKSVQDSEAYITANRHETAEVSARSEATVASAEHLLKITRDSKSGKKTSSEEIALQMEAEKNNVAAKQAQLKSKDNANKALTAENSKLESEQAFNKRFEEARSQFTENEAEVYKQGDTLMIRLKGLEFPVAQAVLKGSNFPLLAKVQKVIKDFGSSSVIVEGHTDSNGGKLANQKLSADRAEAVREFLSSNAENKAISIKSVGYGYQKPLASNKTASGRAQNRRVDVLIKQETTANF